MNVQTSFACFPEPQSQLCSGQDFEYLFTDLILWSTQQFLKPCIITAFYTCKHENKDKVKKDKVAVNFPRLSTNQQLYSTNNLSPKLCTFQIDFTATQHKALGYEFFETKNTWLQDKGSQSNSE